MRGGGGLALCVWVGVCVWGVAILFDIYVTSQCLLKVELEIGDDDSHRGGKNASAACPNSRGNKAS